MPIHALASQLCSLRGRERKSCESPSNIFQSYISTQSCFSRRARASAFLQSWLLCTLRCRPKLKCYSAVSFIGQGCSYLPAFFLALGSCYSWLYKHLLSKTDTCLSWDCGNTVQSQFKTPLGVCVSKRRSEITSKRDCHSVGQVIRAKQAMDSPEPTWSEQEAVQKVLRRAEVSRVCTTQLFIAIISFNVRIPLTNNE